MSDQGSIGGTEARLQVVIGQYSVGDSPGNFVSYEL
jgi:hypothetical protein